MGDCKHHWIIEDSDGPISIGTCKHCRSTRKFFNDIGTAKSTGYVPESLTTGRRGKKLIKKVGGK